MNFSNSGDFLGFGDIEEGFHGSCSDKFISQNRALARSQSSMINILNWWESIRLLYVSSATYYDLCLT